MTSIDPPAPTQPEHAIVRCVAEVSDALGKAVHAPAWSMTPEEQRSTLAHLGIAQAQLSELRLRVLAGADDNEVGLDSGACSTAAWLAHETRQARSSTAADLRLARQLAASLEGTRCALGEGRINEEQARVIVQAVSDLPEWVPAAERAKAEGYLVEQARLFDAKTLRVLGRRLFEVIDPDAADEAEGKQLQKQEREARRNTRFWMRDNGDGTYSGGFKLPELSAQMLQKALNGLTSPRRVQGRARLDEDGRKMSYPQLLGRGFAELVEHLSADKLPNSGGVAATITVNVDLDFLLKGIGAAGLDTGGKISAVEARRLACNAGIVPLVLGGGSVPMDVGREARLYTRYQRVAMAKRDGGCTAEDCDRPPSWCEAHHDVPWSEGGGTSLDTGRLLCSWHHHLAHDPGYTTTRLPSGRIRLRRRM